MATSSSKRASALGRGPEPSRQPDVPADARGASLWWLWLLSDQAMIGTKRPSRGSARSGDAVERSWAFADLALKDAQV